MCIYKLTYLTKKVDVATDLQPEEHVFDTTNPNKNAFFCEKHQDSN